MHDIPGVRFHWGKHLPIPGKKYHGKELPADIVYRNIPKFTEWNKLREENDPNQVFVTKYWSSILSIKLAKKAELSVTAESATAATAIPVTPASVVVPAASEPYFTQFLNYFGLYKTPTPAVQTAAVKQPEEDSSLVPKGPQ